VGAVVELVDDRLWDPDVGQRGVDPLCHAAAPQDQNARVDAPGEVERVTPT
jgi:hypothetical protein